MKIIMLFAWIIFIRDKLITLSIDKSSVFSASTHDVIIPFYHEVDEIYNLACPASPVHYQYDPIKTNKTSVLGAINCLNLAKN